LREFDFPPRDDRSGLMRNLIYGLVTTGLISALGTGCDSGKPHLYTEPTGRHD
jgi:hypothetical protein